LYTVFNEKKREKSFPVFKNIINIRKKTDAYAGIKPAATKTKKNGKTPQVIREQDIDGKHYLYTLCESYCQE